MRAWAPRSAIVVLAGWVSATAISAQTSQTLSLRDAEQRALSEHPQIRAAEYSAQAADQVVREARAAYFPTVTASLTGAQAESNTRIAAGGLNNPTILDRVAGGFSVSQLLTDFGRTAALVQSYDFRADLQRQTVESRRADVLLQVDRAYFTAQRAQAVERVAQETVTARQAVADQTTALAASGLKSGLDVSFAKVNLSEAQLLLVQARNDVQAAFTALSAAMGNQQQAAYQLVDEPLPPEPPSDATSLIAQALRDRADLASERSARRAAEKFADAERALWLPSVSVIGAAGATPYREIGLDSRYAALGINLSLPLASGGLLPARRAEAALKASAEAQRLRDFENLVVRDVTTAWLESQASFRRLEVAEELRAQAADAADLAQARYDIGLGSIVELSQAQLNKTRGDIERAEAQYRLPDPDGQPEVPNRGAEVVPRGDQDSPRRRRFRFFTRSRRGRRPAHPARRCGGARHSRHRAQPARATGDRFRPRLRVRSRRRVAPRSRTARRRGARWRRGAPSAGGRVRHRRRHSRRRPAARHPGLCCRVGLRLDRDGVARTSRI